ncbi:MAG: porin family protein [Hyphomicrobiaceae bacterium]
MKRILCITVAATLLSSAAALAGGGHGDHERSASGFYVGAAAAYASGDYSADFGKGKRSREASGGLFGVKAGYGFKIGSITIGPEAEFLGSTVEYQKREGVPNDTDDSDEESVARNVGINIGSDWLASVQLRAETSLGAIRPYVVGGIAFQKLTFGADTDDLSFSDSDTQTGWTLGAGVTLVADKGFTMDLGYQYYRFDDDVDIKTGAETSINSDTTTDIHAIRVGGTFRF